MDVQHTNNMNISGQNRLCVIMPCFNTAPELLREAVRSVQLERSLIDAHGFETRLVLVDDCSVNKDTHSVLSEIDDAFSWVELIFLAENLGPAGSRNKALQKCDAEWITFLDSDDYWIQGGIASLCEAIIGDPTIEWISGDYYLVDDDSNHPDETFYKSHAERYKYLKEAYEYNKMIRLEKPVVEFLEGSLCSMGSCVISKKALEEIGYFNEAQRKGVDTELYWRLSYGTDMVFVPTPIFVYRRLQGSISSDGQQLSEWEPSVLQAMLKNPQWLVYKRHLRRRFIRSLINLSSTAMRRGQKVAAIQMAIQAIRLKPHGYLPWKHLFRTIFSARN